MKRLVICLGDTVIGKGKMASVAFIVVKENDGRKMARPKRFKNPKRLAIVIEEDFLKHLQKISTLMGGEEDKIVTLAEVVRRGLFVAYPLPGQALEFKF